MNAQSVSWRVFLPADDLQPVAEASLCLPRESTALSHSRGILHALMEENEGHFRGLRWILLTDRKGPLAVLPLRLVRERLGPLSMCALYSLNRFDMLYADAQVREGTARESILRVLQTEPICDGRPCDVIRIRDVKEHSAFFALFGPGSSRWMESYEGASVISTDLPFAAWEAAQSKNLRGQLRQAGKRIGSDQRFRVVSEPDAMGDAFERFVRLECAGYKHTLDPLGKDVHEARLLRDAFQRHSVSGEAFVFELYVGDVLVASQLALAPGETLFLIRVAYNEGFAHASPGTVLMGRLIEWCCSQPTVDRIDMVVRQGWHQRWHPQVDMHFRCNIPNLRSPRGALLALAKSAQNLGKEFRLTRRSGAKQQP